MEDRIALNAGDLDLTFGTDGIALHQFDVTDRLHAMTVQADGKIVAVGSTSNGSGDDRFLLLRLNPNGSRDTSFSDDGWVATDFGSNSRDAAESVALQPDGKIVVAGRKRVVADEVFALARYNADGSPDTTFGSGGLVTTDILAQSDSAYDLVLQPDGKIVVVGDAQPTAGFFHTHFALVRYNADGSLDQTFGSGGKVTTNLGPTDASAQSVVLQPDGKIVAAGRKSSSSGNFGVALVRYLSDGLLDPAFGTGGIVSTEWTTGDFEEASDLVLMEDGRLVIAGSMLPHTFDDAFILAARFHPNGSLDTSFDGDGRIELDLEGSRASGDAVAVLPDGSVLVAGSHFPFGPALSLLARYRPDGSLDPDFGSPPSTLMPGVVAHDLAVGDNESFVDLELVGGKIVAASAVGGGTRQRFGFVRFEGDSVPPVPPVAEAGGPYSVAEGASVPLDGSDSTNPEGGALTYAWDLDGDGLFGETGADALRGDETGPTPTFSAAGLDGPAQIVVSLLVRDAEGDTATDTAVVQVSNAAPVLTSFASNAATPGLVAQGGVVTFSGSFTDAGLPDTHRAVLDWGDGSAPEVFDLTGAGGGTLGASRPYPQAGIFTATLTLTDDDGAAAAVRSAVVVVSGVGLRNGLLQVVGTDADDVVTIKRLPNKRIKVTTSFAPPRTFKPAEVRQIDVRLFGGNDRATVAAALGQPAVLDGGAGDDRLLAGRGVSLLLGAGGADFLRGGAARDFLVAGEGSGTLRGGGGDDLLLAGRTLLEADRAALDAVFAEWRSTRPLLTRVKNITGTGSGPAFDARLNGNHFLKAAGSGATVFAPGGVQDVRGGAGRDWFLADYLGSPPALLGDVAPDEALTELN